MGQWGSGPLLVARIAPGVQFLALRMLLHFVVTCFFVTQCMTWIFVFDREAENSWWRRSCEDEFTNSMQRSITLSLAAMHPAITSRLDWIISDLSGLCTLCCLSRAALVVMLAWGSYCQLQRGYSDTSRLLWFRIRDVVGVHTDRGQCRCWRVLDQILANCSRLSRHKWEKFCALLYCLGLL